MEAIYSSISYGINSLRVRGYKFVKWISDDVTITHNEFTMPDKDVTITAQYEETEEDNR